MSSAICLNLDQSKILLYSNGLTQQNFRLVQIGSICRQKKLNASEEQKIVLRRVENIVGKGENSAYQHFLLFQQCCPKTSLAGSLKTEL